MLTGITAINWSQYSHAYGEASDVPDLIRALIHQPMEDDEEDHTVEMTLESLFSTIWHQGTVYSVTAIAVPFLIELLTYDGKVDKAGILNLLMCCGMGSGYVEVHGRLDHYRDRRHTPEFQAEIEQELRDVFAAHEAVIAGLPVYIALLNDAHKDVRQAAAEAIAICDTQVEMGAVALKTRIFIEKTLDPENTVVAELIQSLGHLLSRERVRATTVPFSLEDNALFANWINDAAMPLSGRVVSAQFILRYGTAAEHTIALNFINTLPDTPPPAANLYAYVFQLMESLQAYDLQAAVTWLTRMVHYSNLQTIRTLPSAIGFLYRTYRLDPAPLLSIMRDLLHHEDMMVRSLVATNLSQFGNAAQSLKSELEQAFMTEKNQQVRRGLTRVLEMLNPQSKPFDLRPLEEWLAYPTLPDMPLATLLGQIENSLTSTSHRESQTAHWIANLADYCADVLQNERTLPLLKQALNHNYQWIRIWAARTLVLLAPQMTQDDVVPVLIEELRGRPVGLIAMDTLAILAKKGLDVTAALPRLRILAENIERQTEFVAMDSIAFVDDQIRDIARSTIVVITQQN